MKIILLIIVSIISIEIVYSQGTKYSTVWFGPNANPVPEFTEARITAKTTISLMGDYYYGYGDETKNTYLKIEIPLLSERVSIKFWSSLFENYRVNDSVYSSRNMEGGKKTGYASGDIYIQTRMRILKEKKYAPSIILNSTLKTSSGNEFENRRYFDTPGYYFDLETGKSWHTTNKFIHEIRGVVNGGFICWETTGSKQNEGPMYGGKIIVGNQHWKFENTLSGYWGWMHTKVYYGYDYGDRPLVYATKLSVRSKKIDYFAQYQYGIKDFPYQQIRVGLSFTVGALTPKY